MEKYPVVYVKWEDHWAEDESWITTKKLLKKHLDNEDVFIETVGYLIAETERSILVGLNVSSDGQIDGNIIIIKKNILERRNLEVALVVGNQE